MTEEFGNWLAGFADGEGSFVIVRSKQSHVCRFHIGLRIDDRPILDEIRAETGLGDVYVSQRRTRPAGDRRTLGAEGAQAVWRVARKADAAELVALFDRHPLRAKKARDFAIWREAVLLWTAGSYCREQTRLAELRAQLTAGRRYLAAA